MSKQFSTPEILLPALRQHRHNYGGDELIPAFDYNITRGIVAALQAENAKQSEWAAIQEDVINHLKAENAEQEAELVKLRKVAVKTLWYFDQANTDCDSVEVLEALEDAGYTYPDENERAALRAAGKME